MAERRKSLFSSSIRSFFTAFFAMMGIGCGIVLVIVLIGAVATQNGEIVSSTSAEIMPNADGKRKELTEDVPVLLRLDISGVIGTDMLNMETVRQQLLESREGAYKKGRVKGILLYVNSPGGTVVDSDAIFRTLEHYKERYDVPIYTYVDGLCASGGLYAALASDRIYASDVSLVGSIGVLFGSLFNFSQAMDRWGISSKTLSAGRGKDAMNPFRPWEEGEEASYQAIVDYYYNRFVDLVMENRPRVDRDQLIDDYGALIFPAAVAQEMGLVDEIKGSVEEALKDLLEEVGITDNKYQVIRLQTSNWLTDMLQSKSSLLQGKIKHQIDGVPEMDSRLMNQFLYLYKPT